MKIIKITTTITTNRKIADINIIAAMGASSTQYKGKVKNKLRHNEIMKKAGRYGREIIRFQGKKARKTHRE